MSGRVRRKRRSTVAGVSGISTVAAFLVDNFNRANTVATTDPAVFGAADTGQFPISFASATDKMYIQNNTLTAPVWSNVYWVVGSKVSRFIFRVAEIGGDPTSLGINPIIRSNASTSDQVYGVVLADGIELRNWNGVADLIVAPFVAHPIANGDVIELRDTGGVNLQVFVNNLLIINQNYVWAAAGSDARVGIGTNVGFAVDWVQVWL